MFYKKAWVEYHPLGVVRHSPVCPDAADPNVTSMHSMVPLPCLPAKQAAIAKVGAIVPWNYPFHNVFNPLTAALFAGNGIVIKVRRHIRVGCHPIYEGPS